MSIVRKLVVLTVLLPMVSRGDIPSPVSRVQRVGYEVLRDVGSDKTGEDVCAGKSADESMAFLMIAAIVLCLTGVSALVVAKKNAIRSVAHRIRKSRANGWHALIEDSLILIVALGVLLLLGAFGLLNVQHRLFNGQQWLDALVFWGVLWVAVLVWKLMSALICLVLRCKMQWYPWAVEIWVAMAASGIIGIIAVGARQPGMKITGDVMLAGPGCRSDLPGWKYPEEISAIEQKVINSKIASVRDELQIRFDSEYARLDGDGKLEAFGLEERNEAMEAPSFYYKLRSGKTERNKLAVVSGVLEQDEKLRMCCKGIPIKSLARAMKCPGPSVDAKFDFRRWCKFQMPGELNDMERMVVFSWQFAVVEKEKRPWREFVSDADGGDVRKMTSLARSKGFSDFEQRDADAAEFVKTWYEKAIASGMTPAREDEQVLARAHASKIHWTAPPNISFEDAPTWPCKVKVVKIHGVVTRGALKAARSLLFSGLGSSSEGWWFDLVLNNPDDDTLKAALDVFSDGTLRSLQIFGDGTTGLDISGLAKVSSPRALKLHNCMIAKSASLSGWHNFERFSAENSYLGELTFLSGCAALHEVSMENCSLSLAGDLQWVVKFVLARKLKAYGIGFVQLAGRLQRMFEGVAGVMIIFVPFWTGAVWWLRKREKRCRLETSATMSVLPSATETNFSGGV